MSVSRLADAVDTLSEEVEARNSCTIIVSGLSETEAWSLQSQWGGTKCADLNHT
jgi:hypothetical protein